MYVYTYNWPADVRVAIETETFFNSGLLSLLLSSLELSDTHVYEP